MTAYIARRRHTDRVQAWPCVPRNGPIGIAYIITNCYTMDMVIDRLYELAEANDGYFTMREATKVGIKPMTIVMLERRGRVKRISRGVYQLVNYPFTERADYWEAVLWPCVRGDSRGVLSHETALLLHRLTDINPTEIHVTVPTRLRPRRQWPRNAVVHRANLADDEIEHLDGIPVTNLRRTIADLRRAGTSVAMVDEAIERSLKEHRLRPEDVAK